MSFNQKLCIIAGGYDKKIPFQPLADPVAERVKLLILTGPTADKIEAAVKASPKYDPGSVPDSPAKDLPEAVALARQETVPGDIVSLSRRVPALMPIRTSRCGDSTSRSWYGRCPEPGQNSPPTIRRKNR